MSASWHCSLQRAAGQLSAGLSWLGDRAGNGFGILVYHRLAPRVPGVPEPTINVTPPQFRRQLAGLQQRGYQFWPLSRVLDLCRHHAPRDESNSATAASTGNNAVPHAELDGLTTLPPRVVVVTFDDGYESVFTEGFPILRELQIPATIFVNTAFLDADEPFPFDRWAAQHRQRLPLSAYRPLRTTQCEELLASGLIELGPHTHTHADFRGRPAEFQADLQTSIEILRTRFGLHRQAFAFPFGRRSLGYVSEELLAAARQTGVRCALTTDVGLIAPSADPFGWGRFNVYDWDTPATVIARLRGWYAWAPRLQDRLARWTSRAPGAGP